MPTIPTRRAALALIAATVAAVPVLAQKADVSAALQTVRRAYREGDIVQRVEVTVSSGQSERSESLLVHTHPPDTLRLSVGPILVWTEGGHLFAVHSEDDRAVLKRALDARGPLPLLDELFPPLPLPQLALAFGPDNAVLNPTPYTRNMAWSGSEADGAHAIALVGAGERCTAELFATAEGLVSAMAITVDDGAADIDIRCEPAELADFPAVDPPVERRFVIESSREFEDRAGLVLVGDPLPALELVPRAVPGPEPDLDPPGAVLFFRQWSRETATALRALRLARESIDGFHYTLVMVFEAVAARPDLQMGEAASETAPDDIFHTAAPGFTVRRFADASSVLVVYDRAGIVRAVTDLASLLGRDAGQQDIFELHAKPDEGAAQRLLEEIQAIIQSR